MPLTSKTSRIALLAAALIPFCFQAPRAEVPTARARNGVLVDATGRPLTADQARGLRDRHPERIAHDEQGLLDFESLGPCFFDETSPPGKFFKNHGVVLKGPSDLDGGAVLDECGGFLVNGHSPMQFLAFNCNATMQNGGLARGPETVSFKTRALTVSLKIGSFDFAGDQIRITAKNKKGKVVDEALVTLAATLQTVTLSSSSAIKKVEIGEAGNTPCIFIVDDITYSP